MNDKVKITLISGKGGDGAIAFRHEKSIMNGGPYGGNGGRGGNISFVADNGINTLADFRFGKVFRAQDGENGKTKLQYGKDASDIVLHVPVGTVVEDENGTPLADLTHHGDTYLAVKGGRGGRGNATFKSPVRRTPNIAENGMPGETKVIYLELKLIADVGLVGYPNVGKSTYLSKVTRANAQIGDYAFTTLEPQLGVCYLNPDKFFVIADLPGLIEGASQGKGLGYTFLRHIERCRVLLHIVDLKRSEDPYQDFVNINNELFHYRSDLLNRKMVIALNKIDEDIPQEVIDSFKEKVKDKFDVYEISAKEGKGLYHLNQRLYKLVNESKEAEKKKPLDQIGQERVYSARAMDNGKIPEFQVVRREDGYFEILGERVIRTYKLINIKTDEGMDRLLAYLDRIGVDEKLREAGAKTGDTVILDDFEFEYYE
ncbi:MAG: GTPase ObgE [bacterium]|nr:GTPase ObgE [bacterium]